MGLREGVSAKIGNYKCFREPQGFEEILPINVIIGRNNSGKSSLLDLIEFAVDGHLPPVERGHRGSRPEIIYGCKLNSGVVAEVFNKSIGDDIIIDFNKYVNDNMIGCIVEWSPTTGKETLVKNFRRGDNKFFNIDSVDKRVVDKIAITLSNARGSPFRGFHFRRLLADRDIRSEDDKNDENSLNLRPDGSNATNIIQRFINQEELSRDQVEVELLGELNHIFSPDAVFRRICPAEEKHFEHVGNLFG